VVDGEDEEESRAARLDGRVVWEADERVAAEPLTFRFSFLLSLTMFRGVITPRSAHSAPLRWRISYIRRTRAARPGWFPLFRVMYVVRIPLRGEGRKSRYKSINQSIDVVECCKENSYSETCARRNAEGGVSLLSGLAHRGGSRFLLFLIYCTGAVYILFGRTK
jgi:hypothetical protein